jgi:hypothetical protein
VSPHNIFGTIGKPLISRPIIQELLNIEEKIQKIKNKIKLGN